MMMSEMVLHKSASFRLLEEIASQCSAFDSEIYLIKGQHKADAKDIMDLVTLSLHPYDKLSLIVKGSDASGARHKILKLLN
jgi:phosphotransferase system HPr-like phosphotransfer protein